MAVCLAFTACAITASPFGETGIPTLDVTATLIHSADAATVAPVGGETTDLWSTRGWTTSTPEAQGIDSNALAGALAAIRAERLPVHSLLIERHGHIVLDAYFHPFANNQLHAVASVTKSVTSTLVGIALGDHRLNDLNEPVVAFFPEEKTAVADPRKARITLAQLLSMTSGLDCSAKAGRSFLQQMEGSRHWASFALDGPQAAEPGSTFAYCAGNMQLLSAVLTRVTGTSAAAFAQRELFAPLGIDSAVWSTDADGVTHGFSDLRLEPRDMAKLGYLWLHNGIWDGKQIVPASYVQAARTPYANVAMNTQYGYGLWIHPECGPAGGPIDFEADGSNGQRIAVIPSLDMVEVITGSGLDANTVSALIVDIARSETALPENPAGDARLESRVAAAALSPTMNLASQIPAGAY
jgi:CubicO group peptidase (beta-lactamase class C family)